MVKMTLEVTGMMCPKCEARVVKALTGAFPAAESVTADHSKNQVVVTAPEAIAQSALTETVAEAGYTMNGMAITDI